MPRAWRRWTRSRSSPSENPCCRLPRHMLWLQVSSLLHASSRHKQNQDWILWGCSLSTVQGHDSVSNGVCCLQEAGFSSGRELQAPRRRSELRWLLPEICCSSSSCRLLHPSSSSRRYAPFSTSCSLQCLDHEVMKTYEAWSWDTFPSGTRAHESLWLRAAGSFVSCMQGFSTARPKTCGRCLQGQEDQDFKQHFDWLSPMTPSGAGSRANRRLAGSTTTSEGASSSPELSPSQAARPAFGALEMPEATTER